LGFESQVARSSRQDARELSGPKGLRRIGAVNQLFSKDSNIFRRGNAELHPVPLDPQDHHGDIALNDYRLIKLPGKDKHSTFSSVSVIAALQAALRPFA